MVNVEWKSGLNLVASTPSGHSVVMDGYAEEGKPSLGPTPLELFLVATASCGAMDVISILEKKRQKLTSYRIEIEGERSPHGSPFPRPYTSLTIKHILSGEDLDPVAVERAIQLSDEKYCSILATLRESPTIKSIFEIV